MIYIYHLYVWIFTLLLIIYYLFFRGLISPYSFFSPEINLVVDHPVFVDSELEPDAAKKIKTFSAIKISVSKIMQAWFALWVLCAVRRIRLDLD